MAVLLAFNHSAYTQKTRKADDIRNVENNLAPNAEYVIAGEPLERYSVSERMEYYKIPSLSIAVIYKGKMVWAKAYGYADVERKVKADVNTIYQAASISKSINAAGILKLVEGGRLALDKDIRQYLKTWTFPDNELSQNITVTIRGLLSHTAGIGTGGFMGYTPGGPLPTINEMLDGKKPANNEPVRAVLTPNKKMQYSGGGTLITKKILQDNFGSDYDSLMQKLVLKPLSMHRSSFGQPLSSGVKNVALAYDRDKNQVPGKYNVYPEQAPDGLWTTPSDLAKFIMSIQGSIANKKGVLSGSTVKDMLAPVLTSSNAGLGLFVVDKSGEKYFTHNGANVGYRSRYYGSFTGGYGVVVFVNSDNDGIINEVINSVALTYKWKNFFNPEVRTIISLPDKSMDDFTGEYSSENPAVKILISKQDGQLELQLKKKEKMFFISEKAFFLKSSPTQIAEFVIVNGTVHALVVKQGDKVVLTAKKM
jgi:CubicO group peptidase (beta-lactamase class C family)